ncbi:ATP-dependent helicase [Vallitalea okinawensis]|uniref:ATP-dependent helicase n=1 Tax=Vallitalea okinawensis TaxID=2078660 RepID=UPI000CFC56EE|nr:ATP-dependent helicase [Vallitalea okinawensis]
MSLDMLNEQQRKAVLHLDGPMMVLAGPGSGKTMVITHRVKHMIEQHNIHPKDILVITFTKAAADEMKNRFHSLMGKSLNISFGTFHSIFFRIIRSVYPYTVNSIIKDEVKYGLFKSIIHDLGIDYEDEQEFIEALQNDISLMKNELIDLKYYNPMNFCSEDFINIVKRYEGYKKEKRLLDFDDMLTHCYQILSHNDQLLAYWQKRFPYILIDEFQDINRAQYEIIKMLATSKKNIFIVGDDDQSIYKFRGARPEFLLDFPEDFEGTQSVVLNINYRSNEAIVRKSTRVIKKNNKRYEKTLTSHRGKGLEPIVVHVEDTDEEARKIAETLLNLNKKGIPFQEMAVIFRTNLQARAVVDAFLDHNLPFILRDRAPSIYDHWIAKDIIAYLKGALDQKDKESLVRIANKPKRYISKWIINELKRSPKDFFKFIYEHPDLKSWQIGKVEELEGQLIMLKIKSPVNAVKYIRHTIGYDDYIKEYANFKKIGIKGLKEILDELVESAKHFESLEHWLQHIDDVREELHHNQKKTSKLNNEDKITLSTMHGAKGLEFEVVWMISVVEGIIPHEKSNRDDEIEEERRLFYVGLTRAKEQLFISSVRTRYEEEVAVSRFLDEMEEVFDFSSLEVGQQIHHKAYGAGKIKKIDGQVAHVKFKGNMATKKIELAYCIKNKLIQIKKEELV